MYSRYSGIKLPQNYSGSRFVRETETKLHTASTLSGVKSSHSPSFVTSSKASPLQKAESLSEDDCENEEPQNASVISNDTYADYDLQKKHDEVRKVSSPSLDDGFSLKSIFENISSEELLILGIILLIATDKDGLSDSALWILALLLLARDV
jgi:hypothetical protein